LPSDLTSLHDQNDIFLVGFGNTGPNKSSMVDVLLLTFNFRPKIALLEVMRGKQQCHDAKYTSVAKDLVFFNKCAAINFPK
jgi:hypothetical protein